MCLHCIADSYILQIQRFAAPVEQTTPAPGLNPQTPVPASPLPLPSIFASKSPQSGRKASFYPTPHWLLLNLVLASLIPTFPTGKSIGLDSDLSYRRCTHILDHQPLSASVSAISDSGTVRFAWIVLSLDLREPHVRCSRRSKPSVNTNAE
jgi:hypothetical protein